MSDPQQHRQFTERQGQYLAFIAMYTLVNRQPPAESDIQAFFGVSPPAVHSMIVQLDRLGFIARTPGRARSIHVLLDPDDLPRLRPGSHNPYL